MLILLVLLLVLLLLTVSVLLTLLLLLVLLLLVWACVLLFLVLLLLVLLALPHASYGPAMTCCASHPFRFQCLPEFKCYACCKAPRHDWPGNNASTRRNCNPPAPNCTNKSCNGAARAATAADMPAPTAASAAAPALRTQRPTAWPRRCCCHRHRRRSPPASN